MLLAGCLVLAGGCRTYPIPPYPPPAPPTTAGPLDAAAVPSPAPPAPTTPPTPSTVVPVTAPPATGPPPLAAGSPGRRFSRGSPAVVAAVEPAVVAIDGTSGAQHSFGTGMVLTTSGQVLTNNHVVHNARTITATVVSTGRVYVARVLGADTAADVALLQLSAPTGLVSITSGTSAGVAPGDQVSVVNNAGGRGGAPTIVACALVATGQSLVATDGNGDVEHLTNLIKVSVPSQPGDSGGPLANQAGQVIGMVVASADGAGYAIPMDTVLAVARRIPVGPA